MLYLGTCRYMYDFKWKSLLPRLHTTREILYALQYIYRIKESKQALDKFGGVLNWKDRQGLGNYKYGDFNTVSINGNGFLNNILPDKNETDIIIEVSSRGIYELVKPQGSLFLNKYYCDRDCSDDTLDRLRYVSLTQSMIESDILNIRDLIKVVFNENTKLHIISHVNLKSNGDYITSRRVLVEFLEEICKQHKINFYDPGKFIEDNFESPDIKDFIPVNHYTNGFDKVKAWLEGEIYR